MTRQGYALGLTAAGSKAVAPVDEGSPDAIEPDAAPSAAEDGAVREKAARGPGRPPARRRQAGAGDRMCGAETARSVVVLTQATGWLPHATRRSQRLRNRGYAMMHGRIGAEDSTSGSRTALLTGEIGRTGGATRWKASGQSGRRRKRRNRHDPPARELQADGGAVDSRDAGASPPLDASFFQSVPI